MIKIIFSSLSTARRRSSSSPRAWFQAASSHCQLSQACPVGTMPPWPPRWWDSALQPRKYGRRGTQTAGLEAKHHLPAAQLVTYSSAHSPQDEAWRRQQQECGAALFLHVRTQRRSASPNKGLSLFSLNRALISVFCLKLGYRFLSPEEINLPSARRTGKICNESKRRASIAAAQLEAGIRISTRVLQPPYRKWTFLSLMDNI